MIYVQDLSILDQKCFLVQSPARWEMVGATGNKRPLASGEAHIGCKRAGLNDDVMDRAAVAEHSVPLR